jgi:outer membrane lipopolysaccharide assembly protein LptE/RlpB
LRVEAPVLKKIFLFLLVLIIPACGYHFPGGNGTKIPHLRTFYVDVFVNKTNEVYAGQIIRSAFINRFVEEGRFKLAASSDRADLVCRGSIKSIQISPLSYKASNIAAEERMTVVMEVIFEESAKGSIIWDDRALTATGDYLTTSTSMVERNRKDALLKLADDAAERAYQLMMSDF